MTFKAGQTVRLNADCIARLKAANLYFPSQDDGVGTISQMLNSKVAQVEGFGRLKHRLLHTENLEHA